MEVNLGPNSFNIAFGISGDSLLNHINGVVPSTAWSPTTYDPLDYGELEIFYQGQKLDITTCN
jgi:hypothetical protein